MLKLLLGAGGAEQLSSAPPALPALPHTGSNLSRWSAHAELTESASHLGVRQGELGWEGSRSSWEHLELSAVRPREPNQHFQLSSGSCRAQGWNTELCPLHMMGWNLISGAAKQFRNCQLLTAALSIWCVKQRSAFRSSQEKENEAPCPAECLVLDQCSVMRVSYSHWSGCSLPIKPLSSQGWESPAAIQKSPLCSN